MSDATLVAEQFDDAAQQADAASLGMWLFLATEVLFFGVLFFAYGVARAHFPDAFAAASRHTNLPLGTTNTAVLLTSSFTMALAVHTASIRRLRGAALLLVITAGLGVLFASIKITEYAIDYHGHLVPVIDFAFDPRYAQGAMLFFWLYFATTGLHLVHLSIGIVIALTFAWRCAYRPAARLPEQVETAGLYWHFVDLVWIFLYPCLYLVART
ncbi:MAG TPA: cytochrome c oxidase subunit 3 [Casimicrobiaceae bacterium]|jgi:cytochrome c oxidase subunit 3